MSKTEALEGYVLPTAETSDEDLVSIATAWEKESVGYGNELKQIRDVNEQYYKGMQTDLGSIPSDMSNAVQNQIFMGVETIIPIITANPPQFVVEAPTESDVSIKYAHALQKVLGIQYENLDIRTTGEMVMRHTILYRLGVFKPYWDEETGDVKVKYVRPQRVFFPKVATELPYIMEKVDIIADEFKNVFGEDKFKEFLDNQGVEYTDENVDKVKGIWTIMEVWTDDLVFWKAGGHIIDKRENPNYDFKNKKNNHFKIPRKPYIFSSVFRLGNEPIGETDLIQQTIPLQDVINVTIRKIIDNANKTGNTQWFVDSQVMTEEEARNKLTNASGLIVYGDGVANANLMRRDPPTEMPTYISELKVLSEKAFDNIFGTHSTTRGERDKQETLGGRMLLKQADLGRIDLIVREYERIIADLGNWITQIMKLNYKGKRTFRSHGEAGIEFVTLSKAAIETGVKVIVKSGTTLPTDEVSKRREAIELWGLGAIGPETLYEKLKFHNPEETAKELQLWKMNQLMMDQQARQAGAGGAQEGSPTGNQAKPQPSPQGEIGKQQKQIRQ